MLDTDFYALQAVNSYLAWDRRTRVTYLAESTASMWAYLAELPLAEQPDVVVLDADHVGSAGDLHHLIQTLHEQVPDVMVVCLVQTIDTALVDAAIRAGARAYFLKQDVRLQIAWGIVYAIDHPLVLTTSVASASTAILRRQRVPFQILPEKRNYPELTDRIRQAIKLCVVEGMPAHLAADEMGISLHTIRGYVKEGYRILESYDDTEYPVDMTPQERAFMRFTALDLDLD